MIEIPIGTRVSYVIATPSFNAGTVVGYQGKFIVVRWDKDKLISFADKGDLRELKEGGRLNEGV